MAPVFDNSWRTGPLGDWIEQISGAPIQEKGYARAIENWARLITALPDAAKHPENSSTLSGAQKNSFRILLEWWNGETQDESLSRAARDSIEKTASSAETDYLDVDRDKSRLKESTYHQSLFLLFELEFVHECRLLQKDNWEEFQGLLHAQREKCAQFAALQRIAHSFLADETNTYSHPASTVSSGVTIQRALALPILLQNTIGACIEPCPWLRTHEEKGRRPFYLWDVEKRCTIQVDQLDTPPDYICISHTWGRWLETEKLPVEIKGVPWLVPQNKKFDVLALPDMLSEAMETGYIWFDLLCIPQDRSVRALIEISRQAIIFSNAISAIAWLNDAESWDGLRTTARWLSLFYLHTSVAENASAYRLPDLPDPYETEDNPIELVVWDAEGSREEFEGDPVVENSAQPWFSSLWTLQEACLRPDMILCDKHWKPLVAGQSTAITLDHLITLINFITRGTYKNSVLKLEDSGLLSDFEGDSGPDIPPGADDLYTWAANTCMSEIIWMSPSSVLTFGQLRQCTSSRAEAIMSVVGATDWFREYVTENQRAPGDGNLVLGYYPISFLNEIATKIGPSFYAAMHTDLRYISGAVDIASGKWELLLNAKAVGSMLPFTSSPTPMVPPQKYEFSSYDHPSVQEWVIQQDGSVKALQAGYLTFSDDELVEKDDDDMIIAPAMEDNSRGLSGDTEIDSQDIEDLEEWLRKFGDPSSAPNYAVCLYQQVYLNRDIPGPQVGLLLKQVGEVGTQTVLVKIGLYFTRASRAWDISTKPVDWIIL